MSARATSFILTPEAGPSNWKEPLREAVIKNDTENLGNQILKSLSSINTNAKGLYLIKKSADEKWSMNLSAPITDYYQILLKLNDRTTDRRIAGALGISENQVDTVPRGRNQFLRQLMLLVFSDDCNEFIYGPKDVITVIGTSYTTIFDENIDRWEKYRRDRIKLLYHDDYERYKKLGYDLSKDDSPFIKMLVEDDINLMLYSIHRGWITRADIDRSLCLKIMWDLHYEAVDHALATSRQYSH